MANQRGAPKVVEGTSSASSGRQPKAATQSDLARSLAGREQIQKEVHNAWTSTAMRHSQLTVVY